MIMMLMLMMMMMIIIHDRTKLIDRGKIKDVMKLRQALKKILKRIKEEYGRNARNFYENI